MRGEATCAPVMTRSVNLPTVYTSDCQRAIKDEAI